MTVIFKFKENMTVTFNFLIQYHQSGLNAPE